MQNLLEARPRKRAWYLFAIVITVAAGLASRHFSRFLPAFLGKYPGDALWSLMVFFGLGAFFRKASSFQLSLGALSFSFAIEALKLCPAPWLANIRHTTLGHLVFGSVFSWQNLVAYAIGVLLGLIIEGLVVGNGRGSGGQNAIQPLS